MLKQLKQQLFKRPKLVGALFNLYRPFRGAGIKVVSISKDYRSIEVHMPLTRGNKNLVGTHFGGSLYAMADPFYMFILIQQLGHRYHVWDQSAHVQFIAPGTGLVKATYAVDEKVLREIIKATETGEKYLYTFESEITHEDGSVVAKVSKVLYIRLKRKYRPVKQQEK